MDGHASANGTGDYGYNSVQIKRKAKKTPTLTNRKWGTPKQSKRRKLSTD